MVPRPAPAGGPRASAVRVASGPGRAASPPAIGERSRVERPVAGSRGRAVRQPWRLRDGQGDPAGLAADQGGDHPDRRRRGPCLGDRGKQRTHQRCQATAMQPKPATGHRRCSKPTQRYMISTSRAVVDVGPSNARPRGTRPPARVDARPGSMPGRGQWPVGVNASPHPARSADDGAGGNPRSPGSRRSRGHGSLRPASRRWS